MKKILLVILLACACAIVTPATNYVHSGTPIQIGISTITNNTTYYTTRYIITNYNQQVGSAASMVSYIFQ